MQVYIYSIEETLFEGEAEVVSLPTQQGEISVLENHIPLVATLGKGFIKLRKGESFDEETHNFEIDQGFAQINPHEVILLV